MAKRLPFEALIWFTGMLLLLAVDTDNIHLSICPLANAGFDWCPGCGLGKSISLFFHGHLRESLITHPLGIFAVVILSFRIWNLTKLYFQRYGKSN